MFSSPNILTFTYIANVINDKGGLGEVVNKKQNFTFIYKDIFGLC